MYSVRSEEERLEAVTEERGAWASFGVAAAIWLYLNLKGCPKEKHLLSPYTWTAHPVPVSWVVGIPDLDVQDWKE